MRKAWRVLSAVAMICLVVGIMGVGVGFFTGSSPVAIQNHGALTEYIERLRMNWDILQEQARGLLAYFGLYI